MTKAELRKLYRQKRNELDDATLEKLQDLVLIRFQTLGLPLLNCISSYLPVYSRREVDTQPVISYLRFQYPGLTVAIPKTDIATATMQHYVYNDETALLETGWGIMEPVGGEPVDPAAIDLVLMPLLAFDQRGYRVGYGKGMYDRFLTDCRADTLRIGLSFFGAEPEITDTDDFDIPLDYCVTPYQVYEF